MILRGLLHVRSMERRAKIRRLVLPCWAASEAGCLPHSRLGRPHPTSCTFSLFFQLPQEAKVVSIVSGQATWWCYMMHVRVSRSRWTAFSKGMLSKVNGTSRPTRTAACDRESWRSLLLWIRAQQWDAESIAATWRSQAGRSFSGEVSQVRRESSLFAIEMDHFNHSSVFASRN